MVKRVKIYPILALLFMPAAAGFTFVLTDCLKRFSYAYLPFFFGFLCYTFVYPVFRKPLLGYVIGHELTHVLGVWLSRGRVYGVRIGRQGGMVKTDKASVWTALLPYFFPIYAFLILGIYYLLSILWDMSMFFGWMVFILGITWGFHFWMTLYIVRKKQPDIKYSGILFSAVIIFTINVIILDIILVVISSELGILDLVRQSWNSISGAYLWILKRLM